MLEGIGTAEASLRVIRADVENLDRQVVRPPPHCRACARFVGITGKCFKHAGAADTCFSQRTLAKG